MIRTNFAGRLFVLACAVTFFSAASFSVQAGTISGPTVITNDATSGVSSGSTYTHALDFVADGSPAVINGVTFTAAGASGANWSSTNFGGSIPETSRDGGGLALAAAVPSTSGIYKLLSDFYYHSTATAGSAETLTLTGLTPGKVYQANVYYRNWDHGQTRNTVLQFDEGSPQSINIDQNDLAAGTNVAKVVSYLYTAGAGGSLVMTMTENGNSPVASWHNYGVSNQLVPEPSSILLGGFALVGLLLAHRRRK